VVSLCFRGRGLLDCVVALADKVHRTAAQPHSRTAAQPHSRTAAR
jgi:hypothetical protein